MTTIVLVLLTILGFSNLGWATRHESSTGASQTRESGTTQEDQPTPKKPGGGGGVDTLTMTGTIGAHGTTFTSDKTNETWNITNKNSVSTYKGRRVTVTGTVDSNKKNIQVTGVKAASKKVGGETEDK